MCLHTKARICVTNGTTSGHSKQPNRRQEVQARPRQGRATSHGIDRAGARQGAVRAADFERQIEKPVFVGRIAPTRAQQDRNSNRIMCLVNVALVPIAGPLLREQQIRKHSLIKGPCTRATIDLFMTPSEGLR